MFLLRKTFLICIATTISLGSAALHGQTLSGGVLTVSTLGAGTIDDILILSVGNNVRVNLNGVITDFPAADVTSLEVLTGNGNDTIVNNTAIPMTAYSGGDDNMVTGGFGDDNLFIGIPPGLSIPGFTRNPAGDNTFFGRDGDDLIEALAGNNFFSGGLGNDTIVGNRDRENEMYGGPGNDILTDGTTIFGGPGNDLIRGSLRRSSFLSGGPGDDRIQAGNQPDTILGNDGDDTIFSSPFGLPDDIDGGPGFDLINGIPDEPVIEQLASGVVTVNGGGEANVITVSQQAGMLVATIDSPITGTLEEEFVLSSVTSILVHGGREDDTLIVDSSLSAILDGGTGDDVLINEGSGATRFNGDFGDDICMTNTDDDLCRDDNGNDTYILNGGTVDHEILFADEAITVIGSGRDETVFLQSTSGNRNFLRPRSQIMMGPGNDFVDLTSNRFTPVVVRCGSGDDMVIGGDAEERLFGDAGDDVIEGGRNNNSNEVLFGGAGDDILLTATILSTTANQSTVMQGGPGNDQLMGGLGDDSLFGGTGDDVLLGRDGNDFLSGQGGNDDVQGGDGDDLMFGGVGNDNMLGGNGNDVMSGGAGDDELRGGNDDDRLTGGIGTDVVLGGAGNDIETD